MFDNTHLLQRKHIRLSLCMIVRDNEDTIEACLASIYPWVDEIIIVDTGSKDRTIEICRKFGARIFEFPWCDDFSAARNESLRHARGEWIFWMDSDDIIDQEQGRRLRELAYGEHPVDCLGYLAQVHCESAEPGQMTVVDQVKLFRNRQDLRFEHRIHEQILPSIRRANGSVVFTNLW
jgi:glycosyltransferase involved in cell wall biosynthesis